MWVWPNSPWREVNKYSTSLWGLSISHIWRRAPLCLQGWRTERGRRFLSVWVRGFVQELRWLHINHTNGKSHPVRMDRQKLSSVKLPSVKHSRPSGIMRPSTVRAKLHNRPWDTEGEWLEYQLRVVRPHLSMTECQQPSIMILGGSLVNK